VAEVVDLTKVVVEEDLSTREVDNEAPLEEPGN